MYYNQVDFSQVFFIKIRQTVFINLKYSPFIHSLMYTEGSEILL